LVNRPGPQAIITAGRLTAPFDAATEPRQDTFNTALGGAFTSRINMNLREDKHWSYGARASLTETRGQRPWLLSAPVQTDKTVESIKEIRRELTEFVTAKPITSDEVAKVRSRDVRALSGQFETNAAVSGAIGELVRFGRPDDYVQTLRGRLEAQTDAGVRAAAAQAFRSDALTWVIVGDLAKIEQPIRELGLGTVQVLDADGNVLR
jgi:predicted Zn-dependent peptidase